MTYCGEIFSIGRIWAIQSMTALSCVNNFKCIPMTIASKLTHDAHRVQSYLFANNSHTFSRLFFSNRKIETVSFTLYCAF